MKHLSSILAAGILALGVAQPGWAQSGSASGVTADTRPSAEQGGAHAPARQNEFQHPMLERPGSTDMREDQGPRIQRRGAQDIRQDGAIERHVDPGDAESRKPRRNEAHIPESGSRSATKP